MVAGYGTAGVDKLTGVSIHWTGPLDWTTRLTFDPNFRYIFAILSDFNVQFSFI